MSRVQKLQLLCPQANSRDNGGFQFPSKNYEYSVFWAWTYIYWGAAEEDDSNISVIVLFVRAVGGFSANGKSEHFACPACYCCGWFDEYCFFQYTLLLTARKVFQMV